MSGQPPRDADNTGQTALPGVGKVPSPVSFDDLERSVRAVRHGQPVDLSVDNVAAVLDAFIEATRGDGGELVDGQIVLDTVRGVRVVAFPGGEGWWEARVEVHVPEDTVIFSAPLLQGPVWYADSDTTLDDVVAWLRVLCDAAPDRDEVEG